MFNHSNLFRFGRIGRTFLRNILDSKSEELEVVCINDAYMEPEFMAYIFQYDSVFGQYKGKAEAKGGKLYIDGKAIQLQKANEPSEIKWKDAGVEFVIESTGFFTTKDRAQGHLKAGAKRVIVTAPSSEGVPTYIREVNFDEYDRNAQVISSASETTYCAAVLCKLLQQKFRINGVSINVVHAATSQERTVDGTPLHEDWRTGRSVNNNIIPTETSSACALGEVIPELKGRVMATGISVPNNNVSYAVFDINFDRNQRLSREELIELIIETSKKSEYKDLLAWNEFPLVSSDFRGRKESVIVDLHNLQVCHQTAKVPVWFDNEWSYSRRLFELLCFVAEKDKESKSS